MRRLPAFLSLVMLLACASSAAANTSHEGWPVINGVLLMNKLDGSRPLDARPGQDPFNGKDPRYSCDQVHKRGKCHSRFERGPNGRMVTARVGHNELLGGHGDDTLFAGPWGDVLWGDYKPSGQGTAQVDHLYGGAGSDFIYASHGLNVIVAGAGKDTIHAHFGRGSIECGGGRDTLFISHRAKRGYKISHCERISFKTIGH
jgi:Ca2+-binding RTX toxin-like protein